MNSNSIKETEEESKQKKSENLNSTEINNKKNLKENPKDTIDSYIQIPKLKNDKTSVSPSYNSQNDVQKNQNNPEDNNITENMNNNESIESDDSQDTKKVKSANYDSTISIKNGKIKFPKYISMDSLKLCQCCNKGFNKEKIPFLLKCNHIFCKKCLEEFFTDEEGIKCPIDGLVGRSLSDIKILYKFIDINNIFNDKKQANITDKRNKKCNSFFANNHKRINPELKRKSKKKFFNLKNNFILNKYDKIKKNQNKLDFRVLNADLKNNDSIKRKRYKTNSLHKNNSITNIINRPYHKSASYVDIDKSNINNKIHNRSNLNEFYKINLENFQNSEYEDVEFDEDQQNYCNIHPQQRITHFVEETKELICIHCAFNKLKNNPKVRIKEIPEKSKEYLNDLDIIIQNNQKFAHIIQNSINDINNNKENEEKEIIEIYEQLLNSLITNRNNFLVRIEEIYQENIDKMNKKLVNFEEIINVAEKLKEDFGSIYEKAPYEFNYLIQAFNKFLREINDKSSSDLNIIQYNFSHDELNKVLKYLNNFADVKARKKTFRFDLLKNSGHNISINNVKNYGGFQNNLNIFRNSINNYYKNDKQKNKINKKNLFSINSFNNKNKDMNYRNPLNDCDIKNRSFLYNSNNNMKINFKYEDDIDNDKYSNILNNNIYEKYIENNNNDTFKSNSNYNKNTSNSESINDTLNKYIASTNIIRDNLYNQAPLVSFKNSRNNSSNNSFSKIKEKNKIDKIEILNKYKIPDRKINK